jgi:phosphatidylserine/phosphatidylglycerophosphate/cardiolipin synthase-like enzyme
MQNMKTIRALLFVTSLILIFQKIYPGPVALFSPDDQPTLKLINLIKSARVSINAAIYSFTDKIIADELIAAHKRRVKVQLIVDRASTSDYGKAKLLHDHGIPISVFHVEEKKYEKKDDQKFFNHAALMHNKFMIIDHRLVWTGSFNWSISANKKNQENIVILDDRNICAQFENHFTKMLTQRCKPFSSKQLVPVQSPLQEKIKQLLASSPDDTTLINNLITLLAQYKPKEIMQAK